MNDPRHFDYPDAAPELPPVTAPSEDAVAQAREESAEDVARRLCLFAITLDGLDSLDKRTRELLITIGEWVVRDRAAVEAQVRADRVRGMSPALCAANEAGMEPVPSVERARIVAHGYVQLAKYKPDVYEVYQSRGGWHHRLSDAITVLLKPAPPMEAP